MSDPLIGQQLANYRIEHFIGQGGMARVYYGWDVSLERPVAIKLIDTQYQSNPSYAHRFVQEARTVAGWRHQNIVQIYYADETNGLYYYAMEYIDGQDLGQFIGHAYNQNKKIPDNAIIEIGKAIASALDYAHSQGVIHRDVKPANVMLAKDRRIILTDFGLAMDVEQGSMGEVFGSAHYVAPEQARRSSEAVPQSDVYSLGIIFYQMLTGMVPFDDPSPSSVALQHLTMEPPPPREINPDINEGTEAVLLKALRKDPQDRYQTASALVTDLHRALHGKDTQVNPPVSQSPTIPSRGSSGGGLPVRLILAGGIGIVLIGLLIGILVILRSTLFSSPESSSPPPTEVAETDSVNDATEDPAPPTAEPDDSEVVVEIETADQPTAVQETAPTDLPVPTQEIVPTNTAVPENIEIEPTILYPDGYLLALIYNDRGFYLWNPGERRLSAGAISFEALQDGSGQSSTYVFPGSLWTAFYGYIHSGNCDALEIAELDAPIRPTQCTAMNAVRTPASNSEWIFWIPREGISTFRVIWDNEEVGRCAINDGYCEVYIP